jgi:Ca2+-binding RTX toxin-like protein
VFELQVAEPDAPPVVSQPLPDQSVEPGASYSFAVPAGAFSDPNSADILTLSASDPAGAPLPSWLTFDPTSNTFSGSPTASDLGVLQVKVTATDPAGGAVSDIFELTVAEVNTPPVLSQPLADQTAIAGASFTYQVAAGAFSDPDPGDPLTLSAALAGGGSLPSWLAFDAASRTFSGQAPSASGSLNIVVTATDPHGASVSDTFSLAVGSSGVFEGASGADTLVGGAGADTLNGYAGADSLDGGAGADSLVGGDGDDVYLVDNSGDVVVEKANAGAGGIDTVQASVSYALPTDAENVTLIGGANINATGNSKGNVLQGNAGDNILDGGSGNDTMSGGAGSDTYIVGQTSDVVTEGVGTGVDLVISAVSYTLGANLENLSLTGTVSSATGNSLANVLNGNSANNKLTGLDGADTLNGGGGADTLAGGAGADRFVIGSAADSPASGPDRISDFTVSQGDVIDLSGIDADINTTGDQAFSWVSAFTSVAGQVTASYSATTQLTTLTFDADGDGLGDDMALLIGGQVTSSQGFIL